MQPISLKILNARPNRLVALNIALLVGLIVVTIAGHAGAQATGQPGEVGGAGGRARGEYAMLAGKVQGTTTSAVYIVDAGNQDFVCLTWDRNTLKFEPLGYRNLMDDAKYLRKPR